MEADTISGVSVRSDIPRRSALEYLMEFRSEDYQIEQIACIMDVQLQQGNMKMLSNMLDLCTKRSDIVEMDMYKRALAWLAFNHGRFTEVYNILETHSFQAPFHGELQDLWYQARYSEAEKARCRSLGAVDKYRLRRKFPLPKTIWDGEETIYCFKEKSRVALKVSPWSTFIFSSSFLHLNSNRLFFVYVFIAAEFSRTCWYSIKEIHDSQKSLFTDGTNISIL